MIDNANDIELANGAVEVCGPAWESSYHWVDCQYCKGYGTTIRVLDWIYVECLGCGGSGGEWIEDEAEDVK